MNSQLKKNTKKIETGGNLLLILIVLLLGGIILISVIVKHEFHDYIIIILATVCLCSAFSVKVIISRMGRNGITPSKSEDKYRTIVENANVGIVIAQDNVFKYANAKMEEISGFTAEELAKIPFLENTHPEDRNMLAERHQKRLKGEIFEDEYDYRIITKDGREKWIRLKPVKIEWENRPAILAFNSDRSQQKETELALQESEEKYRLVIENARESIIILDESGKILLINETGSKLMETKKSDLIGKTLWDFFPKEFADAGHEKIRKVIRTGKAETEELKVPYKNDFHWFISTLVPLKKGDINTVFNINTRITKLKKTEEELKDVINNLSRAQKISKTGSWSWIFGSDEFIFSDEMFRIFGYKKNADRPEHILFETFLSRVHAEDKEMVEKALKKGLERLLPFSFEFRTILIDNSPRFIEVYCDIDLDEYGEPIRLIGTNHDVTQEKETEKKLKEYQENLEEKIEERTKELEKAKGVAEHANKLKTEFLANMGHELRTPLHHIFNFSRFGIRRQKVPKTKLVEYFGIINKSCLRMMNLVEDLLDLSRLEVGIEEYHIKPQNISYVFNNISSLYFKQLKEKNVSLKIMRTKTLLNFDFDKMSTVISHIIDNALKFALEDSIIDVSFEDLADKFIVTIRDKGIQIPRQELKTVFDSFAQSSKTSTGAGGTGLGLSICQKIIEAHQGKIWAEEDPEGATIKFFLPKEILSDTLMSEQESQLFRVYSKKNISSVRASK